MKQGARRYSEKEVQHTASNGLRANSGECGGLLTHLCGVRFSGSPLMDFQEVRKKPVVVEAAGPFEDPTVVDTIEGEFEIDEEYIDEHGGYYIISGVEGELYPCAEDIFHDTYEVVE